MHKPMRAAADRSSDHVSGQDLISLAQKLARDAEHHALLSASLASQADRLMHAGLERLQARQQNSSTKSC